MYLQRITIWRTVGDVSCGAEGKKTLNAIGKTNPDFTVFLGDLAYKKNSLKCFSHATKSEGIKKTGCVIGNNDDRSSSATKGCLASSVVFPFWLQITELQR